jgi:hypothetical protein
MPTPVVIPAPAMFVLPTFVVKTTAAVEERPVISLEPGTIVLEVDVVAIVTVPGRVVIINITGELGLTNLRGGIVASIISRCGLLIDRFGLFVYRCRRGVNRGRCNIHPGPGMRKPTCAFTYTCE